MFKQLLFILTLFYYSFCSYSQNTFQELLSNIEGIDSDSKSLLVEKFILEHGRTPIIENNSAIFLTKGGANAAPVFLADFNGFMHRRYITDPSLGAMENINGTNWYYFQTEIKADAIINYLFEIDDKEMTDPLNPNMQISFGSLVSVLKMPAYQQSSETLLNTFYPIGELIQDSIFSDTFKQFRNIHIYLPPNYQNQPEDSFDLAFFHDGTFNINEGLIPRILDNLITEEKIRPIIAVFDDPIIRGKEYRGDEAYLHYIQNELIPFIAKNYRIKSGKENKAVFGWSRGGMSALYVSYKLNIFGKAGVISPAIYPENFKEFLFKLDDAPFSPEQIFISGSTYDKIWYNDAILLKNHFQNTRRHFNYMEIHAGHNISAWRTVIDDMLISFYPQ